MAHISGNGGDITVGGTALLVEEWNANYTAEEIDTTNHGGGGFKDTILGVKGMEGSCSGKYHDALPSSILAPQIGAAIVLQVGDDGGTGTYSFSGITNNFNITSAATGELSWSLDFKSQGSVTASF